MVRLSALAAVAALGVATMGLSLAYAQTGQGDAAVLGGPEAAAAAAPAAGDIAKGKEAFGTWGCSACHVLADAGATGPVGPSLDGDPNLTAELITSRIRDGQGPMPAFGGQMTDQEIADVTAYILHAAAK